VVGNKLTGASVYRGHDHISTERLSTINNGGLGTLVNTNIHEI